MSINSMSELQVRNLLEGCGLDTVADLSDYLHAWRYFECGEHYVVLCVCINGEVDFSVDGAWETDNVSPLLGAIILKRLLKEWQSLKGQLKGLALFCTAVVTDGCGERRSRMYKLAGFSPPDESGRMHITL